MQNKIEKTIKALEKNNMRAIFVPLKKDIVKTVKEMLFEGAKITNGGSVSVIDSGVAELIKCGEYNYLDRSRPGITPEEQLEVYKNVLDSDFYFCSSNAITEEGELVNVDGNSNRISAIAFGPKNVIIIAGVNKLVRNAKEGFLRIKKIAAPKNCVRLGINSPCATLGHCISLERSENPPITDGCSGDGRICVSYLVSGRQKIKNRITVIICGEELGY